jgi:hypothetical protein
MAVINVSEGEPIATMGSQQFMAALVKGHATVQFIRLHLCREKGENDSNQAAFGRISLLCDL